MLDINFIRENKDLVKKAAKDKGVKDVVDELLQVDEKRRQLIQETQNLRTERNELMKNVFGKPSDDVIEKGKKLKEALAGLEPKLKEVETEFDKLMLQIPNVPAKDVPIGKDSSGNVVFSQWGQKPDFKFPVKDHITLAESLDMVDFKRGTKVAGFRGYYLKGDGALLHMAVLSFSIQKLISKGFTPVIPPIILKDRAFYNTAHFPWGKVDVYKTFDDEKEQDQRFLAGTAEVPLVSYHQDEVLREKDLPKLYAGYSPCFRREIGSYGKDTTGMYRIHEFTKVEQVIICKNDWDESFKWFENLRSYSEEILQDLGLHYRVLLMCTGDMGEPQVKKYDLETWMPGRNEYGETHSCSTMGEFQSRRANVKYQTATGEIKYTHMLNNTAIASPRVLIAIMENYQQEDGSIKIPEVLQPFMGGKKVIKK
ncbi:serine--tRNA ligase [Candidatus Beckwithbacteria bacterium]|nr:serine--tRNA ligase [Candidatus Beckwithbacteria bacterium]